MHVCLLIDLLALFLLVRGLFTSATLARRLLCLTGLVYLLAVSLHYFLLFASWFGFFHHHRSIAAIGAADLLDFFGGFWTFFGVMVLAKGVSYVALGFAIYRTYCWFTKPSPPPRQKPSPQPRQNALISSRDLPPE